MISPRQVVQTKPEELELLLEELLDELLEELLDELFDELVEELLDELFDELLELSSSPPQPDKLKVNTAIANKVPLKPGNHGAFIIEGLHRMFIINHMMINTTQFENAS